MREAIIDRFELSPEFTLMLSLALRSKRPQIPERIDWQLFETLVSKNRVEPLVAEGIRKLSPEIVRDIPAFRNLLATQSRYAALTVRQIGALSSLMKEFGERKIRALSVKGPILAAELYGNPALRYSRDLDILVSGDDLEAACGCLEELGYTEEITVRNKTPLRRRKLEENGEEMHRVYIKEEICVELHWRLSFRMNESFDDLWENSRKKVLLGQEIRCLGEKDNTAYLITHAAGHGYHRLRWLIDIYELQNKTGFAFDDVYRDMAEQNVGMLLLETVLVLHLIPGFRMPECSNGLFSIRCRDDQVCAEYEEQIERDFQKARRLAAAVVPIIKSSTAEYGMAGRKYDRLLPTLGRKKTVFRSFLSALEPGRADLELIDLPDGLYFLYYLIRPFNKIWRMLPFSH